MKKYITRNIKHKSKKEYIHEYVDKNGAILSKNVYGPLIKHVYIAPAYEKVKINLNRNDKVLAIGIDSKDRNSIHIILITFKKPPITNIRN